MYLQITIRRTLILILDMAILSVVVAAVLRNFDLSDRAMLPANQIMRLLLLSLALLSTPSRLAILYHLLDRPGAARDRLIGLLALANSYMMTLFLISTLMFLRNKPIFRNVYYPNLIMVILLLPACAIVTVSTLFPTKFNSAVIALVSRISRMKKNQ